MIEAHTILGVQANAAPDQIRSRYLELVRKYPPDQNPEKFREIHNAYQVLSDPLVQADALTSVSRDRPILADEIEKAKAIRGRLPTLALLALGNQE